jgi:hypothetical protein
MSKTSYLVQRTYIQKSRIFLLPLTGIPFSKHFLPTNTYIASPGLISDAYPEGIKKEDQILIILYSKVYKKRDDELYKKLNDTLIKKISSEDEIPSGWDSFETNKLLSNPNFLAFHETKDEFLYTFDLSGYGEDWNNFLDGRYSLFHEVTKEKVKNWRWLDLDVYNQTKLLCYLWPTNRDCLEAFAQDLRMEIDQLRDVKELCDKPNLLLETYKCLLREKYENKDKEII